MDQGAPAQTVSGQTTQSPDGLAGQVAAVESARARLGDNLDRLNVELRAEVGQIVEKTAWKAAAAAAGIVAGLLVRQVLVFGWKKARHAPPPDDPAAPGVGWGEAVAWTVATATGMGIAKLAAIRGAAVGWQKATGAPPPGLSRD